MLVGERYRIELDAEQAAHAEWVRGSCRAVWNAALEQPRAAAGLNRKRTVSSGPRIPFLDISLGTFHRRALLLYRAELTEIISKTATLGCMAPGDCHGCSSCDQAGRARKPTPGD